MRLLASIALMFAVGLMTACAGDASSTGEEWDRQRTAIRPASRIGSLKSVDVPEPSNLSAFVIDKQAAIRLGKAFYWDMQVGSDGLIACATCHHSAGADRRTKNQIRPRSPLVAGAVFYAGGPNSVVQAADFPFRRLVDPDDARSAPLFDAGSNRVASSGVFRRAFVDVRPGNPEDDGTPLPDPVFHVGGVNVRRASIVNAPTTINAVFNFRQLAAGQASDTFNGFNTAGTRDQRAVILRRTGAGLTPTVVMIDRASLASQAMGPPLDPVEMSYAGRTFPKLGKKMLTLRPLAKQHVDHDDSVLGQLAATCDTGLDTDYAAMIRAAFRPDLWDGSEMVTYTGGTTTERVAEGAAADAGVPTVHANPGRPLTTDEYTPMEANFSLFWGLALQLYQATLVSDDSPFDRFADKRAQLTPAQMRGLLIFTGQRGEDEGRAATCAVCHTGAELTAASVRNAMGRPIERISMLDGSAARDTGFMNIAVRPSSEGQIQGGADPVFGAFSLARWLQLGNDIGFDLDPPIAPGERLAIVGAIKAPTLRNLDLTGPYFHTGGAATLRQVVDFYVRGGDFPDEEQSHLDPAMVPVALRERDRTDLVEFLLTLTDDRVRREAAPFDHPQLFIPAGHPGGPQSVEDRGSGEATDTLLEVPAVGRDGTSPLQPFLALDPHQP